MTDGAATRLGLDIGPTTIKAAILRADDVVHSDCLGTTRTSAPS